jgi:hypothetical protein
MQNVGFGHEVNYRGATPQDVDVSPGTRQNTAVPTRTATAVMARPTVAWADASDQPTPQPAKKALGGLLAAWQHTAVPTYQAAPGSGLLPGLDDDWTVTGTIEGGVLRNSPDAPSGGIFSADPIKALGKITVTLDISRGGEGVLQVDKRQALRFRVEGKTLLIRAGSAFDCGKPFTLFREADANGQVALELVLTPTGTWKLGRTEVWALTELVPYPVGLTLAKGLGVAYAAMT